MKIKLMYLALAFAPSAMLTVSAFAQEKNSQAFSPAELTERTLYRRAVEAVIWGMPAVNAELMFEAMPAANADFNQVVYWSRPIDWKAYSTKLGKSHLDFNARWIHDFDVSKRVEGNAFNFSASLKF